jgi:hypothetical protein
MLKELMHWAGVGSESPVQRRYVNIKNPALGADWSVSVPGGKVWLPLAVNFTIVCSATVANRAPQLMFLDGSAFGPYLFQPAYQVVASAASSLFFTAGLGYVNLLSLDGDQSIGIPYVPCMPGWLLTSRTINLQAGDQIQSVTLEVLEADLQSLPTREAYPSYQELITPDAYVPQPYRQPFNP